MRVKYEKLFDSIELDVPNDFFVWLTSIILIDKNRLDQAFIPKQDDVNLGYAKKFIDDLISNDPNVVNLNLRTAIAKITADQSDNAALQELNEQIKLLDLEKIVGFEYLVKNLRRTGINLLDTVKLPEPSSKVEVKISNDNLDGSSSAADDGELSYEDKAHYLNQPKGIYQLLLNNLDADVSKTWGDVYDLRILLGVEVIGSFNDFLDEAGHSYILPPKGTDTLKGDIEQAINEMTKNQADLATLYIPVNVGNNHWTLTIVTIENGIEKLPRTTWDPLKDGVQKDGFRCMDYVAQKILIEKFGQQQNWLTSDLKAILGARSGDDLRKAVVSRIQNQLSAERELMQESEQSSAILDEDLNLDDSSFNHPELDEDIRSGLLRKVQEDSTNTQETRLSDILDLDALGSTSAISPTEGDLELDRMINELDAEEIDDELSNTVSTRESVNEPPKPAPAKTKTASSVASSPSSIPATTPPKQDPKHIYYYGDIAEVISKNNVNTELHNFFGQTPIQRAGGFSSGTAATGLIQADQARLIEQTISVSSKKSVMVATVQTVDAATQSCRSDFHGEIDKLAKLPRVKKSVFGESFPHEEMLKYTLDQFKNHIAISVKDDGTIPSIKATGSMPKECVEAFMLWSRELNISFSNMTFSKVKVSDKERKFFNEECADLIAQAKNDIEVIKQNKLSGQQPGLGVNQPVTPTISKPVASSSAVPVAVAPAPRRSVASARKPKSIAVNTHSSMFRPASTPAAKGEGIHGDGYCRGLEVHHNTKNNKNLRDTLSQATFILDQVNKLYQEAIHSGEPCGKIGLTYSANHNQTEAIKNTYQKGNWKTGTAGANQAEVVAMIETQLSDKKYSHLQTVFRLLPITTMTASGDPSTPDWLKEDLEYITDFAKKEGNMVLCWQNQASNLQNDKKQFAVGGGVAKNFTQEQSDYVQAGLKVLYKASQTNPSRENIPPVPNYPVVLIRAKIRPGT